MPMTEPLLAAFVGGFLIIAAVIVVAIVVIGSVFTMIGRRTRGEERGGNVHAPDDPRKRPPRA